MVFTIKSKEQYDAMSAYDQAKYDLEKKAYDKEQADKREADTVAKAVAEAVAQMQSVIETLKTGNAEAIEALKKDNKEELEKMEAVLRKAKVAEIEERLGDMSSKIEEKLSTPEGLEMLKQFQNGQRERFNMELESKAMSKPTTGGGGVAPQFTPIVGDGHDTLNMRNIIPTFPTISDVVKYVQMVLDTTAAGIGTVAEGATKPTMNYVPTPKEAPVRKIAGLLDITDEMLDDVVGLRAWLAYELPKAYLDAEDLQILKGDGLGQNLTGLYTIATAQTYLGTVTSNSNAWDKIISAVTQVRKAKRNSTAVIVSPVAYMELYINKDLENGYTYPIVMDANGTLRAGGVPIYWSNVLEDNEGLVGDFARGTAIFQRKAMVVSYSDQHKDNFAKNIQTIRIEGRIALPIFYPDSFVKIDFTKTPPTEGGE